MKNQKSTSRWLTNRLITLFACLFALNQPVTAQCSCSDYFTDTADTSEYAVDIINNELYQTTGSAYCTGLKKYDLDEADKSARENLSQLIYVKVQTKDKVRTVASDFDTSISEYTQQSQLESNLTINGSYIVKRWVDAESCAIFASIRLSNENAQAALETFEDSFENSSVYVESSAYDSLDQTIIESLKLRGVNTVSVKPDNQRYVVTSAVFNVSKRTSNELTLNIRVDITDSTTGGLVKSLTVTGRSMSFKARSDDYLQTKAVKDGLIALRTQLNAALADIQ